MPKTRDWVRLAVRTAEDKKAANIVALDLRGLSSVTDYFIVCSGTSDTQVRAIAEAVREKLLEKGQRPFGFEGAQEGTWVLLDYVDWVMHVFHQEKRLFYGIEDLWADAKKLAFRATKTPAAMPTHGEGGKMRARARAAGTARPRSAKRKG